MAPRELTIGQHIEELRRCVFRSVVACVASFVVCFVFIRDDLMAAMVKPVMQALADTGFTADIITTSVSERFLTYTKICLVAGTVLASPYIAWQIWSFVAEGLHPSERKIIRALIPITVVFFIAGVAFCYFAFLPMVLGFLLTFGSHDIRNMIRLEEYVGFFASSSLIMGFVFELPVVILFCVKFGFVSVAALARARRFAILGAVIIGAVATPGGDIASQLMVAAPLVVLYEIGILASAFVDRESRNAGVLRPSVLILTAIACAIAGVYGLPRIPPARKAYWEWQARSGNADSRMEALGRLMASGDASAAQKLRVGLSSADISVRLRSATYLARANDTQALKILVDLIGHPQVGRQALSALQDVTKMDMTARVQQRAWQEWLREKESGAAP